MENKKKVIILGHSPLPIENTKKNFAPGTRTWHFAYSAKDAGCKVLVIGIRIPNSYDDSVPDIKLENIRDIQYYSVNEKIFSDLKWINDIISKFQPDCIVGVNTFPASIVSDLDLDIPFWADLNGSVMVEAQAKAHLYNDDVYLHHFFKMESKILSKADIFSVVSEAQGFSLIGELGIWGRLNKNTMGYRFIKVIPNTAEKQMFKHKKNVFRKKLVKDSDFVILYSGGYNTWTDIDTMFDGISKAMEKNPNIVFVSTGGQITGHDDITYNRFEQLIKNSPFKDRFHLFGWVPFEDLPNYYLESDLAINSDRYCYEAIIGARTRILDWIRAPLPYISTPLSEITDYMTKKGMAFSFQQGDSDDLANMLIKLSKSSNDLEKVKNKLKHALDDEFTAEHTLKEFRNWLSDPKFSPDHKYIVNLISNVKKPSTTNTEFVSLKEHVAILMWPKISKFLHVLHLSSIEKKLYNFGIKIISKKLPIYNASIKVGSIPNLIENEKYLLPVQIKNTGNCEWLNHKAAINSINLSYIWKDKSGNAIFKFEERTPLPYNVKPKKTFTIDMMVTTPQVYGDYILEVDLLKEHEFWFSDVGSKPTKILIPVKKKLKTVYDFPLVSVIIVTYNSTNYIEKCLENILQSSYPDFEIIVVDNSSSDDTLKKLEKFKGKIKLVISKENLGFGVGNNLGIKNSKGDIFVLINPDANVTKDAIKELIIPMLDDPKIAITGSKIFYPDSTKIQSAGGIMSKNALPSHFGYGKPDSAEYNFQKSVDYVTGASMAINKKLFEKIGLFNPIFYPAYFEETDICVKAKKLGYKVIYSPKSVVYHHESTTLVALSKNYLIPFHRNRFKFIYKNFSVVNYLFKFWPNELKWYILYLGSSERAIVLKTHIQTLSSLFSIITRKSPSFP